MRGSIGRLMAAAAFAGAAAAALAGGVRALAAPVVVELFTSQGCSSCPPADELLGELAAMPDVIALSVHVDYWDYLGWRDVYARPENTRRQKAYGKAGGERSVYTPQMVINGQERLIGSRKGKVLQTVQRHRGRDDHAQVRLEPMGDRVKVHLKAGEPVDEPCTVWVVPYDAPHVVDIRRGENAGRQITYHNVARDWMQIGTWNGENDVVLTAPMPHGARGVAVILQQGGIGPIVGAAKLEF